MQLIEVKEKEKDEVKVKTCKYHDNVVASVNKFSIMSIYLYFFFPEFALYIENEALLLKYVKGKLRYVTLRYVNNT